MEKQVKILAVRAAMAAGSSLNAACAQVGVSPASFSRWNKDFEAAEGDAHQAFTPKKPTGRPPTVEFGEMDLAIARWHRLCKSSLEIAIHFYCRDQAADPEIVAILGQIYERGLESGRPAAWPMSVRRAFEVSAEEMARFRSQKAVQGTEMVSRRGMIWIDEQGQLQDLLPGELWELDDYSANQPFTYRDPQTGELDVGRQILGGMDVTSAGWLGFDLIGRPRDAYRGEDIVRMIGRLFRAHGVPRFLRLERGSWDSSFVHGIKVKGEDENFRWGGLDALTHISHVFKSKAKGTLEGSWNPLQNWLAHAGRDIGRYAGEFEQAAKAWRQVKNAASRPDPRKLGFWEQGECAAAHEEAAKIMNSRPRKRRALAEQVAPDDLVNRLGWHTTPIPEAEAWRLLPWKERCVVSNGVITVRPGRGWPQVQYVVNGQDGYTFDAGHVLLVACDPADPAAGAYICNGDRSAKNRQSWGFGQLLIPCAPIFTDSPQIDLSGRRHGTIDLRRKAAAAAATEFRAIKAGARGKREVSVFNGAGASATAGSLPPIERPLPPVMPVAPTGRMRPAPALPAPERGGLPATDRASRIAALKAAEAAASEHF